MKKSHSDNSNNSFPENPGNQLWAVRAGKAFLKVLKTFRWIAHFPILLLIIVAVIVVGWGIKYLNKNVSVNLTEEKRIGVSAEDIERIREIGQWEFLTFKAEEMVDTIERHWYGDKELVRIYPGILRIGIDLKKVSRNWFVVKGDTAFICLPQPTLLDTNFIDEARARTFYEKGKWDAKTQEALYRKAHRRLMMRALTQQRLEQARRQARAQFSNIAYGLGLSTCRITFDKK